MDQWTHSEIGRRTFLKMLGAAGGAVVVGLPLSGCIPAAPAPKALFEAQTGAAAVTGSTSTATYYIGEGKGFFAEEGIKNMVTEFQSGTDAVRGVLVGGLHYGLISIPPVVTSFMQGEPLRIVGGWWPAATSITLAVKSDAPYKTLQDLKGKKVGYSRPASLSYFFVVKAIRSSGLNEKDFNLLPVGGAAESRTALMAGVVDASWMPDYLMVQGTLDKSVRAIFWAYELVKDWQELAVVTKPDFIKSNPDVLKRFLRASQKTLDWGSKNLDEAAKIWAQAVKIDPAVATQLLKAAPKGAFTTKLSPAGLKVAEESMLEFKQIGKPVPWKELVDQSLLPTELRAELPS